ncbi:chemotaxis protein CheB [Dyella sp. LX-66]|uniref:chemotaxis protein CheB n=1 Tax=unclassified Dyella TaxID=2634549 RepID=UPI001BE09DEA|nr:MULTISPECIES: chemotaxis protein CheB [unclassified Dyella]MBT2115425.1 chemotaxis protein CheB [Dyella sp. LX-1]MBT2139240.1 chemotaxis protein CheB [Dyella sp. LX-66]
MAEAPAVALLFDDAELGAHLREALRERGARIVHEGALGTLSREVIHGTGAQVVVVNLDDEAADDIDRLYDVIDGDHPRVVFNDAQASRGLDGWDRARWARHLAVKVLADGDIDPPRPADALAVETPVMHEPVAVAAVAPAAAVALAQTFEEPAAEAEPATLAEIEPVADITLIDEAPEILLSPVVGEAADVSESLAAELEALLAADTDEPADDDFGSGLKPIAEDAPPLHDGMFGTDFGADFLADTQGHAPLPPVHEDLVAAVPPPVREELTASIPDEPLASPPSAPRPSFQLDHLALAPLDDSFMPADTPIKVEKMSTAEALHASWSLVDEDAPLAEAPAPEFGIEKVSAADFLAPDVELMDEAPLIEPGMTLELVSIEEAIAPREEYSHEVHLGELDSALGRVLLLGATVDSTDSVCAFLAALPSSLRMAVLLTQHQGAASVDMLSERLSKHSALPVRIASHGQRARAGEVLLVPANRQVRLLRDGRVECEAVDVASFQNPSIDSAFTTAANVFGRDAVAIVFAGPGTDAVAGAQAVHDRGGRVWVEQASGDHYADMVHGVEAERLASFTGTPFELAARLIEEEVQR